MRMKRLVRGRPDLQWISTYCDIVQVGFLAFLINGAFVNMEYFDIIYHWVAIVAGLKVLCYRALRTENPSVVTMDDPQFVLATS